MNINFIGGHEILPKVSRDLPPHYKCFRPPICPLLWPLKVTGYSKGSSFGSQQRSSGVRLKALDLQTISGADISYPVEWTFIALGINVKKWLSSASIILHPTLADFESSAYFKQL